MTNAVTNEEQTIIFDLKKGFPSDARYSSSVEFYSVLDKKFETIKEELINDVSARSTQAIESLPPEERLKRFSKVATEQVQTTLGKGETSVTHITEEVAKKSGKAKWIAGGIIVVSIVIGAVIALNKKKGYVEREQERRQGNGNTQIIF